MAVTSLERGDWALGQPAPIRSRLSRPPGGSRLRANWDVADGVCAVRNHRDGARCHCRRL